MKCTKCKYKKDMTSALRYINQLTRSWYCYHKDSNGRKINAMKVITPNWCPLEKIEGQDETTEL